MKKYLCFIFLISAIQSNAQWTGATIDSLTHNSDRDELNHQCIDIDSFNMLHVLYMRANPGMGWSVFYRSRDVNSIWSTEENVGPQVAYNPVIAASNVAGEAFIAYEADSTNHEIYLCSNAGGPWNCIPITSDTLNDMTPTIDVDSSGFVHLAWVTEVFSGVYKIRYATNASGTWAIQTINNSMTGQFGNGAIPYIAVEKNGIAHIAFRGDNGNGFKIHHMYNLTPGGSTWNLDYITTANDLDYSCVIRISNDSTVHVLVSGNDGFGFPSHSFYQTKHVNDTSFSGTVEVGTGYTTAVGDLFVDEDGIPEIVLNEISGNIYTGNVIYVSSSNLTGTVLLGTNDIFQPNLVLDAEGHATLIAYQGLQFQDYEIIVYGTPNTVEIHSPTIEDFPVRSFQQGQSLSITFDQNWSGRLMLSGLDGKISESLQSDFSKGKTIHFENLAKGIYILRLEGASGNFAKKISVK